MGASRGTSTGLPGGTQPTKRPEDENFPVGSWLLPARLRPHIRAYYDFARAIDDIADDPARAPNQKIADLDRMEAVLLGATPEAEGETLAGQLALSLTKTGIDTARATELCIAFRQDAIKNRYQDWSELMNYCRYSAAPVGRFLLDLHGESAACWAASDALCASLQVINHIQDCKDDLQTLDRVYVPLDWMRAEGASTDHLLQGSASPALRNVLDRMLDGVDALNREAATLPRLIHDRRMRLETAVIVDIAHRLARLLRRHDPVAERVSLSTVGKFLSLCGGIARAI
ncbi:MAG: squalene synthase HpnC [Alphaproteobacteria bacterium]